jgi:hypothetical protein
VEGPPVSFNPFTQPLNGSAALHFVIPTEA